MRKILGVDEKVKKILEVDNYFFRFLRGKGYSWGLSQRTREWGFGGRDSDLAREFLSRLQVFRLL
jgi:hypothetical protein